MDIPPVDREDLAQNLCRQRGCNWATLTETERDAWRGQADQGLESMFLLAKSDPKLLAGLIVSAITEPAKRWLSDLDSDAE